MDESVVVTPQGDRVDTAAVSTSEGVVHRQRISIADDAAADAHAAVSNTAPAAEAFGLVTRNIPAGVQHVEVDNLPATQPVSVADPVTVRGDDLVLTVEKLTQAVEAMQELLAYQIRATRDRNPALEVPYARSVNYQLKAIIEGGSVTITPYWGASNVYPLWYSTGAPFAVDPRQTAIDASTMNVQIARQRWSFT